MIWPTVSVCRSATSCVMAVFHDACMAAYQRRSTAECFEHGAELARHECVARGLEFIHKKCDVCMFLLREGFVVAKRGGKGRIAPSSLAIADASASKSSCYQKTNPIRLAPVWF